MERNVEGVVRSKALREERVDYSRNWTEANLAASFAGENSRVWLEL